VLAANRRQPDSAVVARVLGVADPEHADVEQSHGAGQHPPLGQLLAGKLTRQPPP
jgi:hypothetical protein